MLQPKEKTMNKYNIVALDTASAGADISWIQFENLGNFKSYAATSANEVKARIADADIVINNKVYMGADEFKAAPNLKLVAVLATGFDHIDTQAAKDRDILVCNVKDYSTASVAQHVFALMLDLAGSITLHANAVANGEWASSHKFSFWKENTIELANKTLGIIGYGATGSAIARLGHAFNMNILVYSPRPKNKPDFAPFEFTDKNTLFAKSDFISLNCPLTETTKGMINLEILKSMKPSAFLINCSRGGVIVEKDLRTALEQGIIAGAGLDVTKIEPMPTTSPLYGAPNCIITPHIAWASCEARKRLLAGVWENIKNFIAGTPKNVVN